MDVTRQSFCDYENAPKKWTVNEWFCYSPFADDSVRADTADKAFLRSWQFLSYSPRFMEPESSLPHLQEPVTCPLSWASSIQSTPHPTYEADG
jgi:hypothetical protein